VSSNRDPDPFLVMFGQLAAGFDGHQDRGATFPQSDADDLAKGARFIPGEVTMARREGRAVRFVQECSNRCCWYWALPNGKRAYHWAEYDYEAIKPGPCPTCGNPHIDGGTVMP